MTSLRAIGLTNIGLLAILGALLVAVYLAIAPGADATLGFSGIGPGVSIDGQRINVEVVVSEDEWCGIQGPIQVEIGYPRESTARLVSESFSDDPFYCGASTQTNLIKQETKSHVTVSTHVVHAHYNAKMVTRVSLNGYQDGDCYGQVNDDLKCNPIKIDDGREDDITSAKAGVPKKVK